MISVCIPIYNRQVDKLVGTIAEQCAKAAIPWEIICMDDKSRSDIRKKNRVLDTKFGVNYVELSSNVGRSAIRNKLSTLCRYENILFLDCDVKILRNDFITQYVRHSEKASIVCGGIEYSKNKPKKTDRILHWTYGSNREAIPANKRNEHPVRHFHSSNFLIKEKILRLHPFVQLPNGYGYEDFHLGLRLNENNFKILHIDNPVQHLGLNSTKAFLARQIEASQNLSFLTKQDKDLQTPIVRVKNILHRMGLTSLFIRFFQLVESSIERQMLSKNPSLFMLDLYKTYHFLTSNEL